jgi:hypothetical protein
MLAIIIPTVVPITDAVERIEAGGEGGGRDLRLVADLGDEEAA